jgi:hypothetical protein
MKTKNINLTLYDYNEICPADGKWCICIVKDYDTNEIYFRSAYYEHGVFWDTSGSGAEGIGEGIWWAYCDDCLK